jgi:hypothetical protein
VLTDREAALDLRLKVEVPVLWLVAEEDAGASGVAAGPGTLTLPGGRSLLVCHPRFPGDVVPARELLAALETLDLTEPFGRIREAIAEARRTGVTSRAA